MSDPTKTFQVNRNDDIVEIWNTFSHFLRFLGKQVRNSQKDVSSTHGFKLITFQLVLSIGRLYKSTMKKLWDRSIFLDSEASIDKK